VWKKEKYRRDTSKRWVFCRLKLSGICVMAQIVDTGNNEQYLQRVRQSQSTNAEDQAHRLWHGLHAGR
jgi:hypothetical protein